MGSALQGGLGLTAQYHWGLPVAAVSIQKHMLQAAAVCGQRLSKELLLDSGPC